MTEEQQVRARRERLDGALDRTAGGDGVHLQAIGDERAAKSELGAQQVAVRCVARASRDGADRRPARSTCALIIAGALRATAANGTRSRARSVAASVVDDRQRCVRIERGRAVTGKVLVARKHAALAQSARERLADRRDSLRIGAEGTRADHRVRPIERQIEHRSEIERAAGSAQIECRLLAGTFR